MGFVSSHKLGFLPLPTVKYTIKRSRTAVSRVANPNIGGNIGVRKGSSSVGWVDVVDVRELVLFSDARRC